MIQNLVPPDVEYVEKILARRLRASSFALFVVVVHVAHSVLRVNGVSPRKRKGAR